MDGEIWDLNPRHTGEGFLLLLVDKRKHQIPVLTIGGMAQLSNKVTNGCKESHVYTPFQKTCLTRAKVNDHHGQGDSKADDLESESEKG